MLELLAVELPGSMRFLQPGWWVFHLAVIPLIFVLGMVAAKRGFDPRTFGRASP